MIIRVIFLLFSFNVAQAGTSSEIRTFADSLYKEQDYYRAITEYKRHLHRYPKDSDSDEVNFSIGFSYYQGNKYDAATPYFQKLSTDSSPLSPSAQFLLGQNHLMAERYEPALREWRQFSYSHPNHSFRDAVHYQMSWVHFLKEDLQLMKKELSQIHAAPYQSRASAFMNSMSRWDERPSLSPWLAGIFSAILPGSGQWYTGRFWDGLSALVINSLFAYGIYYTLDRNYNVGAGVLTFVGIGFYGGNIASAIGSAHKYNQRTKTSLREEFRIKYGLKLNWNGKNLTLHF